MLPSKENASQNQILHTGRLLYQCTTHLYEILHLGLKHLHLFNHEAMYPQVNFQDFRGKYTYTLKIRNFKSSASVILETKMRFQTKYVILILGITCIFGGHLIYWFGTLFRIVNKVLMYTHGPVTKNPAADSKLQNLQRK